MAAPFPALSPWEGRFHSGRESHSQGKEIHAPEEIFGTVQAMSIEEGFLVLRDAEGKESKFAVDEDLTTIVNVIARRVGKRVVHSVQARKL